MTMELEGNILLERAPTRRWVSIIAVVIPAAAFAMLATWFIRVYIAPPTVAIPSPMMMASAAPQPPAPQQPIETRLPDPPPPTAAVSVAQVSITPPTAEPVPPPTTLPMLDTLSAAPPAADLPRAEPAQEASSLKTTGVAQSATAEDSAPEASEPIAGPVPLPRSKPRLSLARLTGPVPLPRPKPVEEAPPPDLPATDIHAVQ